jgi:ribosomal protein S18 acetylase RimI-like enzyme
MEIVIGTPSKYSKSKMVSSKPPTEISKGSYFLLLKHNGDVVGSLIAEKYRDAYTIRQVEVIPEHRGMGHGREMMTNIISFLKPKKKNIILYVQPNNKIAVSLYTSLGFKLIQKAAAFGDKYLLTPN